MQREVIKWTQSLDLSFPIKNPRKDLANGFLIAEMLSRYDKDVSMHAFGTELAMQQRLNNWQQIGKILDRMKCVTVTKELIEGTIQQKGLMARDLLDQLYMFLTKRTLKPNVMAPPVRTLLEQDNFSRPTAASLLREANDATKHRLSIATGATDEVKLRQANEAILKRHTVVLQSLKLAEPERYQPRKPSYTKLHQDAMSSSRMRGGAPNHTTQGAPLGARGGSKTAIVKEVEIRGVDDSILSTFHERDQKAKEEALRQGFSRDIDLATALSAVIQKPITTFGLTQDLDALFPSSMEGAELLQKFVALRQRIPVQVRSSCWAELHGVAKNIAKHVVLRPREFAHLVIHFGFAFGKDACLLTTLQPTARASSDTGIQDGTPASAAYDVEQAFALLIAVGGQLVAQAPDTASSAVAEHLVPAMLPVLMHGTTCMVEAAALVLTSFVHHHHLDGIRQLISVVAKCMQPQSGAVSGSDRVLLCVTHLLGQLDIAHCAGLEAVATQYAAMGLGGSSAISRGCSAVLLLKVANATPFDVVEFLPALSAMRSSTSWEVRLLALECLMGYHRAVTREESGGSSSARRRSLTVEGADPAAVAELHEQQLATMSDSLQAARDSIVALIASFDGGCASDSQRRAALLLASRYLDNDSASVDEIGAPLLPRLCLAAASCMASESPELPVFYFGVDGAGLEDTATVSTLLDGRVRPFHRALGAQKVWSTSSLIASLTAALEMDGAASLSTLDIVQLLRALAIQSQQSSDATLAPTKAMSDDPSAWFALLSAARQTIVTAATDPGQCRGVQDKDLAVCADVAYVTATLLFMGLAADAPAASETDPYEMRQRALEWVQSFSE